MRMMKRKYSLVWTRKTDDVWKYGWNVTKIFKVGPLMLIRYIVL